MEIHSTLRRQLGFYLHNTSVKLDQTLWTDAVNHVSRTAPMLASQSTSAGLNLCGVTNLGLDVSQRFIRESESNQIKSGCDELSRDLSEPDFKVKRP